MNITVLATHMVKLRDSEKSVEHQDLASKLEKLWNMKVMVIPIIISAHGTVTKLLVKELEDVEVKGRVETIQITALLRSAKILS